MNKKFSIFITALVFSVLLCVSALAAETVYVDGVGTDENCYKTLFEAFDAVDDGGTVVLKTDYNYTKAGEGNRNTTPAKAITVTSESSNVLTMSSTFKLGGKVVFDNITIKNNISSSGTDFIYCCGNDLVIGEGVVTQPYGTSTRYMAIFAANSTIASSDFESSVTLKSGTWRFVGTAGNTTGATCTNSKVTVNIYDGATIYGTDGVILGAMKSGVTSDVAVTVNVYGGTVSNIKTSVAPVTSYTVNLYGGTIDKISVPVNVNLTNGGSVTITDENEQIVTTLAAEGYEVVKEGTTYSVQEKEVAVSTIVYLDGTGETTGAYTDSKKAIGALTNGGTVIVTGDTYVYGQQPVMTEKIKIVGATGNEKIILDESYGKSIRFQGSTEIDNLILVSNVNTNGYTSLITMGNEFIIGENVTCEQLGKYGFTIYGGAASGTLTNDSHIVVKGGTFRRIYGGNSSGTFNGNSLIEIYDATIEEAVNAKNQGGTFNGTATVKLYSGANIGGAVTADNIVIDLTNGGTVTGASFGVTPEVIVPDGAKLFTNGKTYTVENVETIAYVDGTGATEGAYSTLADALANLPFGGTVIVSGNSKIGTTGVLPTTGTVVITSKYGDEDYTDVAALNYDADFTLGGDTTFRDIVLERTKTTNGLIFVYAAGNPITMDTGVICRNYTGHQFLSIVGGAASGTLENDSHVTIKSGIFHNVYGANRKGTFIGDSYVDITGGSFVNGVCGGNYVGSFTGDVHLTFAGSASLLYVASSHGLVGGNIGDGSTTTTFTGNIYMTLGGKSGINHNIFGGSKNTKTTTNGNVEIIVEDNVYVGYAMYAGGYLAGLNGNVRLIINGGYFCGNIFGGTEEGTVTGNTYIEINDGKLCYNQVNLWSATSKPAGTANVYAGGNTDCVVNGTCTIVMNGGNVYGDISGDAVTLTGGTVFGAVLSDNTIVDLSKGGEVSIGVSSDIKSLIGDGKLTLSPAAKLTVNTLSGSPVFAINGLPLPVTYVTVQNSTEGAELIYLAQENEELVKDGNNYNIDFEGSCATTVVRITHKEGFSVRLRAGYSTMVAPLAQTSVTDTSATYTVSPGLYMVTVVANDSNNTNWERKTIYIDGRSETYTLALEFDKVNPDGHDAASSWYASDEMLDKYYDATDLEGYFQPDTPFFNKRYGTSTVFTTNEELVEFLAEKDENCNYMYVYEIAKSPYGYSVPLVLFTLDPIPEGATLAEAAEIVRKTKGRDIIMIDSGIHGDEVGAQEGAIGFVSEMASDYGMSVLEGTNIGAVIIVPRLNPDAAKDYARLHPTVSWLGDGSINSDFMALSYEEVAGYAKAYQLFMPTLTIDGHEAGTGPLWSPAQFTTDIYDVAIKSQGSLLCTNDILAVLDGDRSAAEIEAEKVAVNVMNTLQTMGIRSYYYQPSSGSTNCVANFGLGGSYSFLLETPGIGGGHGFIARRAFVQMTCVKELINVVLESDGEMARNVEEARRAVATSAQVYDGKQPVVLHSAKSFADERRIEWNNPLIGADNTVRVAENPTYMYTYDTAIRYRTLPTAYVMAADAEGIADVLALLDRQGIAYKKLSSGTAMSLQPYSGTKTTATVGEATTVTFENGAYLVPVDGARAYITAYLFEPDSNDNSLASFVQLGLTTAESIYRSTESYIAAKNGMDGTYMELSTDGKIVSSAVVDGVTYDNIDTEDGKVYVVTSDSEYYSVTLNFTDGTSKKVGVGNIKGDMNGDGTLSFPDVLMLLRIIIDEQNVPDGDINGDGQCSLIDVLRLMKTIINEV